jgi:hypothetical protein
MKVHSKKVEGMLLDIAIRLTKKRSQSVDEFLHRFQPYVLRHLHSINLNEFRVNVIRKLGTHKFYLFDVQRYNSDLQRYRVNHRWNKPKRNNPKPTWRDYIISEERLTIKKLLIYI